VRWVLEEAAHKAKTRPPLAHFYAECTDRRGKHIATVAVARNLLQAIGVIGFQAPYWARQRWWVASLTSSCLATSGIWWPSVSSRSVSCSLRMICSGVCRCRFT
jgi:hypothetical protein